jgi:hypothetical protein
VVDWFASYDVVELMCIFFGWRGIFDGPTFSERSESEHRERRPRSGQLEKVL